MIAPDQASAPRYLQDSAPGDLLRVRLVAFEFVPRPCWDLKIRVGDLLLYLERQSDGVVVARSDGRQVLIPQECTGFVGVQRLFAMPAVDADGRASLDG